MAVFEAFIVDSISAAMVVGSSAAASLCEGEVEEEGSGSSLGTDDAVSVGTC